MSLSLSINEAKAFSEIYKFGVQTELAVLRLPSFRTINESTQFLQHTNFLSEDLARYDQYVAESEDIVRILDLNNFKSGIDPFYAWLIEHGNTVSIVEYNQLLESGIWDTLKAAGKAIATPLTAGAEAIGSGIKWLGGKALSQFPWGQKVIDFLKALTEGGSPIGIAQLLLDILGAIPGSWIGIPIDTVANVINAIIYFGRGMYFNGVISLLSLLPLGNIFKAMKVTFAKPFAALANITKGVATKDANLIAKAGNEMAKLSGSSAFLSKISGVINSLGGVVKKIIGEIVLLFKKFLPDSWIASIEKWMTTNIVNPVRSTEEAIKIADEFVTKKGGKNIERLEKGGKAALADELTNAAAKAKQGIKLPSGAVTKKAGTILADEAKDIAVRMTGKISRAEMDALVRIGDKDGIKKLFSSVAKDASLTKVQKELVEGFARAPQVFIECQKISKRLNLAIDAIAKLAGGQRKLIKVSRLAGFLIRDFLKTKYLSNCLTSGPYASFYKLAVTNPDTGIHEAYEPETDQPETTEPLTNNTIPTEDQATEITRKQLAQLQIKNADPETQQKAKEEIKKADKLDPCSSIANQAETDTSNALVTNMLATATQTPYGDYKPVSDEQSIARFEKLVNPELERMGVPPVHEYVYDKLYRMSTADRAKYIDVFDPVKKEVSVAPTKDVENERFEAFIKEEVERTGMSESEVRAIVNRVKKENHEMDQNDSTTVEEPKSTQPTEPQRPNESKSYRLKSFKNFINE